jgi:uncharacterized protein (TIGR03790 family)
MMRKAIGGLLGVLAAVTAWALGPHEVLVLANANAPDSVAVARAFMTLRAVPEPNLVLLDLPASPGLEIAPEAFTAHIWEPAHSAMAERGIAGHILAWVYATDIPVAVRTDPVMSIQGLTFLRNTPIPAQRIADGRYRSPLYAGPDTPQRGLANLAQSLDVYKVWLGDAMPLPSMMLGVTGPGGLERAAIVACLERGAASDGTAPSGTVYFVTSDDPRSTCRDWQFRPAAAELAMRGVRGMVTNGLPRSRDVLGIQMGAANVDTRGLRDTFLPGAMAEHLTSYAGKFDARGQTLLTAWLAAGATASAGTVTEPRSIWTKFPNARFFVHYADGCTLLESFYQAIGSPLQILLVGEPLAQPWRRGGRIELYGAPEGETWTEPVDLEALIRDDRRSRYTRYVWLVDGRVKGDRSVADGLSARRFLVPVDSLEPGPHTVRVVAYRSGLVRVQTFAERMFRVAAK